MGLKALGAMMSQYHRICIKELRISSMGVRDKTLIQSSSRLLNIKDHRSLPIVQLLTLSNKPLSTTPQRLGISHLKARHLALFHNLNSLESTSAQDAKEHSIHSISTSVITATRNSQ
jgi:hypothetical protein